VAMSPILVADLFPAITRHLLDLLRSLGPLDWPLPTVSSERTVKDIVSHLLDGSLRRLSMQRDGYRPVDADSSLQNGEALMVFLNRLNRNWETAARRLSPGVLIELIEYADARLAELMASLDPYAPALFPVAWAGEEHSQNWMDIAREYTEKWHHTQQIFHATGRRSTILSRELGYPCLDIFMRALPFIYRDVEADIGSVVAVHIEGVAGGSWFVERQKGGWQQVPAVNRPAQATVTMPEIVAWKLVTKRRSIEAAKQVFPEIKVEGDQALGSHIYSLLSVMA
jgi:Mycothiol maleylpyruvate isomerase N-terminal domain